MMPIAKLGNVKRERGRNVGRKPNPTRSRKTAFVFAGGGSLGAVEVGMLKALVAAGIRADLVVGSSVGALNAAYFAARPNENGVKRLEAVWRRLRTGDVFPFSPLRALLALFGYADGLTSPNNLKSLLVRELPLQSLEQARLPCHVVATDILDGDEVVLSSGPAVDALLASAAIPGVFPPVELDGRDLCDGGVSSTTPIARAIALGAGRIVVLPTGFPCSLSSPPSGAVALAVHAINLLINHQLVVDIERFQDVATITVVPPLCPLAVSPLDFSEVGEMIDRATKSTRQWLDHGGLRREGVPSELRAHRHADSDSTKAASGA
jgi:NTE family protein